MATWLPHIYFTLHCIFFLFKEPEDVLPGVRRARGGVDAGVAVHWEDVQGGKLFRYKNIESTLPYLFRPWYEQHYSPGCQNAKKSGSPRVFLLMLMLIHALIYADNVLLIACWGYNCNTGEHAVHALKRHFDNWNMPRPGGLMVRLVTFEVERTWCRLPMDWVSPLKYLISTVESKREDVSRQKAVGYVCVTRVDGVREC